MHKIVSTLVTLPRGAYFRYSLSSFSIITFFIFLYSLGTIQLLHINFFTHVLGIALRVPSLKKPFHSISPSDRSHFRYFGAHLWVCSSILESCSISSYEILYRWFLHYSDRQFAGVCYAVILGLYWVYSTMYSET